MQSIFGVQILLRSTKEERIPNTDESRLYGTTLIAGIDKWIDLIINNDKNNDNF